MEDAANILGAGTMRTTLRITLPMVLPAILGGAIVTFLEAIALFGSPALIAIPARFNVVTTQLLQFFSQPIRAEVAAAYAVPLLLITVVLVLLQRWLISRRGFVALTGKGGERRLIALGALALGRCSATALFVLSLSVLLPYAVLAQAALGEGLGPRLQPGQPDAGQFPLSAVRARDRRPVGGQQLHLCRRRGVPGRIGLALSIAYIVSRRLLPFAGVLGFLCMAPFVVPGIVLAIAFYAAYAPPPFSLYGTATDPDPGLHHPLPADRLRQRRRRDPQHQSGDGGSGAHPRRRPLLALRRVLAPLMKRSLIGAWLLVFIPATRELSTAMFLYGPKTRTMSVMLLDMSEEGNFEYLAALGLPAAAGATMVIVGIGQRAAGPRLHAAAGPRS